MRHWSDAKQWSVPTFDYAGFSLWGNELDSCCFSMNGRITTSEDQSQGGQTLHVGQQRAGEVTNAWNDSVTKSFTSGPVGTCKQLSFHIAGFVKDRKVHAGVIYSFANRESLVTNPHEVYEIDIISSTIQSDIASVWIRFTPRLTYLMDFSISGDIYS